MTVVDDRNMWKDSFEAGHLPSSYVLDEYREKRNDKSWRTSGTVEVLCEYILYLEGKINDR